MTFCALSAVSVLSATTSRQFNIHRGFNVIGVPTPVIEIVL